MKPWHIVCPKCGTKRDSTQAFVCPICKAGDNNWDDLILKNRIATEQRKKNKVREYKMADILCPKCHNQEVQPNETICKYCLKYAEMKDDLKNT